MRQRLLLALLTMALSCSAQESGDGGLLLPFLRKLESLLHTPASELDSNGFPIFQPAIVVPHEKSKPKAGTVTLTAEQYSALYGLAAQAQSQPAYTPPVAVDTAPIQTGESVQASADQVSQVASPTLQVALPATAPVTRPPKSSSNSAVSAPLRRKQR